jgi:hypothetical protein
LSLGDKIERLTDACMNVRKIYVRQSCGLIYRFLVPSSNLSLLRRAAGRHGPAALASQ